MSAREELKTPYIRRRHILELVTDRKMISLESIKNDLQVVSMSTVRRDVLALQAQGKVLMLRGGLVKLYDADRDELPMEEKVLLHKGSKDKIARCAAGYVREGETIYIDSGTTTAMMLQYLTNMKITIITSSTYIIKDAIQIAGNLIVLGGEVNISIASISGPTTDRQMYEMYFDRAFIGANGFSLEGGISTYDMREASKKRIAHERSGSTFVLADSSKAGRSALCKAFSLKDCILITDEANDTTALANAVIAQ